jgi:hypothetical protein
MLIFSTATCTPAFNCTKLATLAFKFRSALSFSTVNSMRPTCSSGILRYTSGAAPEVAALVREVDVREVLLVPLPEKVRGAVEVVGDEAAVWAETEKMAMAKKKNSLDIALEAMVAAIGNSSTQS